MVDTPKVRQAGNSWPLPDHGREQHLFGLHTIITCIFCFAGVLTSSTRDDAHPLQTQPPPCTLAHAQRNDDPMYTTSVHCCVLLPRVDMSLSATDTLLEAVVATTSTLNRNRCLTQPLPSIPCCCSVCARCPLTPTLTCSLPLCTKQRYREEEEVRADEATKKFRQQGEDDAWAPAEANQDDVPEDESSDEEEEPEQESGGLWAFLDGEALVEAQLAAAQEEVEEMAKRGAFNRPDDPLVSIVCFSDEGKGAFSEKGYADMISGIIGPSKEVTTTVLTDKFSKAVAYELSAPKSVADTILRSTPAQRAGWRFWKRSEDPEEISRLPQKIAALNGLEVIRIQRLPAGVAAWRPEVRRIIAEWFIASALKDEMFAARLEHLNRCASISRLSEEEAAGWSAPGIKLVSVAPGMIVSDYKATTIISRLDLVVRVTNESIVGKRVPFIPMEAAVPLKIEQKGFDVTLGADKEGFSAGESNMSDKDKATSYQYIPIVTGEDPSSGKPTACKADLLLLSAADGDFQLGNVEWCPVNHPYQIKPKPNLCILRATHLTYGLQAVRCHPHALR